MSLQEKFNQSQKSQKEKEQEREEGARWCQVTGLVLLSKPSWVDVSGEQQ